MTNQKNEGNKIVATKGRLSKLWSILLGLVLVAAITGSVLAYNGREKGRTFDDTFTKWVTTFPNMVGVVGGDVGVGTYTGEMIEYNPGDDITTIHALYHFNGSKHAFTADVNIIQDNQKGTATITGEVTEGWLKGASVTGEYNVLPECPIETPDNAFGTMCFQGTLHVHVPK
jgi:hypothetical protein